MDTFFGFVGFLVVVVVVIVMAFHLFKAIIDFTIRKFGRPLVPVKGLQNVEVPGTGERISVYRIKRGTTFREAFTLLGRPLEEMCVPKDTATAVYKAFKRNFEGKKGFPPKGVQMFSVRKIEQDEHYRRGETDEKDLGNFKMNRATKDEKDELVEVDPFNLRDTPNPRYYGLLMVSN